MRKNSYFDKLRRKEERERNENSRKPSKITRANEKVETELPSGNYEDEKDNFSKTPGDHRRELEYLCSTAVFGIVLFLGLSWVLWILSHHAFDTVTSVVHDAFSPFERMLCRDDEAILHLQMRQLERARYEIFGPDKRQHKKHYTGDDLGFYLYSHGFVNIIPKYKSQYSRLVYYRIQKAANEYIYKILYEFAKMNDYSERDIKCTEDSRRCISKFHRYSIFDRIFSPRVRNHFSFTFVRNPLTRFVSGYSEVENQIAKLKKGQSLINFKLAATEPADRIVHFINAILHYHGSSKLVRDQRVPMSYVAPMIGTLLLGLKREQRGWNHMRIYKVENFTQHWNSLIEDSGIDKLQDFDISHIEKSHSIFADNFTKKVYNFLKFPLYYNSTIESLREDGIFAFGDSTDVMNSMSGDNYEKILSTIRSPDGYYSLLAFCQCYTPFCLTNIVYILFAP